jgi:hypothetical protein
MCLIRPARRLERRHAAAVEMKPEWAVAASCGQPAQNPAQVVIQWRNPRLEG